MAVVSGSKSAGEALSLRSISQVQTHKQQNAPDPKQGRQPHGKCDVGVVSPAVQSHERLIVQRGMTRHGISYE